MISIAILTNRVGEKDWGFHLMQTHKQVGVSFAQRRQYLNQKTPAGLEIRMETRMQALMLMLFQLTQNHYVKTDAYPFPYPLQLLT